MKRFLILLLIVLVVTLCGCSSKGKLSENDIMIGEMDGTMFFRVSEESSGRVIVDKATRVMYWLSCGSYNYGTLTMLVNPDGTPRIWEG